MNHLRGVEQQAYTQSWQQQRCV